MPPLFRILDGLGRLHFFCGEHAASKLIAAGFVEASDAAGVLYLKHSLPLGDIERLNRQMLSGDKFVITMARTGLAVYTWVPAS